MKASCSFDAWRPSAVRVLISTSSGSGSCQVHLLLIVAEKSVGLGD